MPYHRQKSHSKARMSFFQKLTNCMSLKLIKSLIQMVNKFLHEIKPSSRLSQIVDGKKWQEFSEHLLFFKVTKAQTVFGLYFRWWKHWTHWLLFLDHLGTLLKLAEEALWAFWTWNLRRTSTLGSLALYFTFLLDILWWSALEDLHIKVIKAETLFLSRASRNSRTTE